MDGLKEFNAWWDSDELVEDNPFDMDTAIFWAWEGWQAGIKREREECAKVCDETNNWPIAHVIRARGSDAA